MTPLEVELWTSWASMLRVYSAAQGLNSTHHAVVEVGAEEIVLRVDTHWLRFTHTELLRSEGSRLAFALQDDGSVMLDGQTDEMDMAAESVTRQLFQLAT